MSSKEETVVYALKGVSKYSRDGHFVDMPDGWEFVPSGDPALTRRLKAAATDYWVVKRKLGQSAVFAQIALTLRDFTSPDGNQVQLCYIKFWHIRNKTGYDLHVQTY